MWAATVNNLHFMKPRVVSQNYNENIIQSAVEIYIE